jgi:Uma2 family endonuclease
MATQPQPHDWTCEDLLTLPDDGKRYEIIEGVLHEMPAANTDHALIIMRLILYIFGPLVHALGIQVLTAPVDVFIRDGDPVQPDLMLLLPEQRDLIAKRGVEGPPALVVEVLSPSNPEHDRITKRALYARAGVPEYWIVSPEAATIEILALRDGHYAVHARVGGDEPLTSPTLPALAGTAARVFGESGA